ncbi:unnamed protein product [Chironomus riparius]|uniref:Salivary secreted peptide n=1 Tax=Chironomus riparius TaxID=315576 RepID=A0A9N9RK17_9DIPT|nr:unnamed protein product [Chironomus riparius]
MKLLFVLFFQAILVFVIAKPHEQDSGELELPDERGQWTKSQEIAQDIQRVGNDIIQGTGFALCKVFTLFINDCD